MQGNPPGLDLQTCPSHGQRIIRDSLIRFSSEAVADKVKNGLGFSGENEEVMRSHSLNSDIPNLTREL
jgi:hypothetical protein